MGASENIASLSCHLCLARTLYPTLYRVLLTTLRYTKAAMWDKKPNRADIYISVQPHICYPQLSSGAPRSGEMPPWSP
jgi:hypothetical protein